MEHPIPKTQETKQTLHLILSGRRCKMQKFIFYIGEDAWAWLRTPDLFQILVVSTLQIFIRVI